MHTGDEAYDREKCGVDFMKAVSTRTLCCTCAVAGAETTSRQLLLRPRLFGLYVDRLEEHLLENASIDVPTQGAVLVLSLLYAHAFIS